MTDKDRRAEELLVRILDGIGVEAQIEIDDSEERLEIRVATEEAGLLIGRRGETLDSLQYLLNVMVNKGQEERRRIIIDVEGYREERKKQLEEAATKAADQVVERGEPVALQPMNPFERRIVHMVLVAYPGVETVSEGEEPYRSVKVVPESVN